MDYSNSTSLYEQAKEHLGGGVSSNFRYAGYGESPVPLFYAKGSGSRLTDVDGNVYIDYALANGPAILGHAPPPVLEAVSRTLAMGQLFAGQHELELELARRITGIVPCAELVRFASSGSEAVQAALRLARAHTGRRKIVKFEGHYHGWLDNIFMSVAPSPNEAGPALAPVPVSHTPGQPESVLGDVLVLPWNDIDVFAEALRTHRDEIAGVIMEPILCNTGALRPRPGYLEGVRELTAEHGAVLIFDEVITGFRVGLQGAQGLLGVTPDLAVFAKALAAGFPLAAVVGRREVMERVEAGGGDARRNVQRERDVHCRRSRGARRALPRRRAGLPRHDPARRAPDGGAAGDRPPARRVGAHIRSRAGLPCRVHRRRRCSRLSFLLSDRRRPARPVQRSAAQRRGAHHRPRNLVPFRRAFR